MFHDQPGALIGQTKNNFRFSFMPKLCEKKIEPTKVNRLSWESVNSLNRDDSSWKSFTPKVSIDFKLNQSKSIKSLDTSSKYKKKCYHQNFFEFLSDLLWANGSGWPPIMWFLVRLSLSHGINGENLNYIYKTIENLLGKSSENFP